MKERVKQVVRPITCVLVVPTQSTQLPNWVKKEQSSPIIQMDTPLKLNLSPLTLIPSNLSKYQNPNGSFPFSMRDLTHLRLTRFNLNYFHRRKIIHHHCSSVLQIKPVSLARFPSMAEAEGANKRETQPPVTEEGREKTPAKELPPPPEKLEPGDCCGSGCVRCVWDVYYEELDAYDQLLKQFNSQSQSP